jgi:hypothetical protein
LLTVEGIDQLAAFGHLLSLKTAKRMAGFAKFRHWRF